MYCCNIITTDRDSKIVFQNSYCYLSTKPCDFPTGSFYIYRHALAENCRDVFSSVSARDSLSTYDLGWVLWKEPKSKCGHRENRDKRNFDRRNEQNDTSPADMWRNDNAIAMSKRRCDVVLMSQWRYYCVVCPLGDIVSGVTECNKKGMHIKLKLKHEIGNIICI